ncbi:MAG TPA: hypothetical protein VGP52_07715 [Stellaceae bacterium]|nr:hypothetical protein [Stellaceae bacterium]
MLPAEVLLWKLSEGRDRTLGLSCSADGLRLAGTPLIERRAGRYALRPWAELERLFRCAYGEGINLDRLMPGFRVVASALDENNLCLAQIAAVQLRVPDLPGLFARRGMEAEDLLIKRARVAENDRLVRTSWDPAEHPRAGVPPNPGWFAPTDGAGGCSTQVAQEEDERAPAEMLDRLAPLRQAQWDAAMATLREIDPGNPNLTEVANPGSAPSQEALDRLEAAVKAAAIRRVTDKVMPSGVPIGQPGRSARVRELPGGVAAAENLFDYLRVGATVSRSDVNISVIELPSNAGFITFRPQSRSVGPAIDLNISGIPFKIIHFY